MYLKVNLFLRERERVKGRVRERERERERETIPRRPHAVSMEPEAGLEPMNPEIMTGAETKSQLVNLLNHQVPL